MIADGLSAIAVRTHGEALVAAVVERLAKNSEERALPSAHHGPGHYLKRQ